MTRSLIHETLRRAPARRFDDLPKARPASLTGTAAGRCSARPWPSKRRAISSHSSRFWNTPPHRATASNAKDSRSRPARPRQPAPASREVRCALRGRRQGSSNRSNGGRQSMRQRPAASRERQEGRSPSPARRWRRSASFSVSPPGPRSSSCRCRGSGRQRRRRAGRRRARRRRAFALPGASAKFEPGERPLKRRPASPAQRPRRRATARAWRVRRRAGETAAASRAATAGHRRAPHHPTACRRRRGRRRPRRGRTSGRRVRPLVAADACARWCWHRRHPAIAPGPGPPRVTRVRIDGEPRRA